jgi:hypothetical protein
MQKNIFFSFLEEGYNKTSQKCRLAFQNKIYWKFTRSDLSICILSTYFSIQILLNTFKHFVSTAKNNNGHFINIIFIIKLYIYALDL